MKKSALLFLIVLQFISLDLRGDTVVGVHGFLASRHSLRTIKKIFENCEIHVCLWEYQSRKKFIEEHGFCLAQLLQEIACACPGEPIHFVTHSIGALVVRAALNVPWCPVEAQIGRAVLIAPPNQGSCLARKFRHFPPISFAMGKRSGWQLMNYDPREIACIGEFPLSMEVLVLAGTSGNRIWFKEKNDGLLLVKETWLNTPFYYQEFPLSHSDLLKAPKVLCSMRNFIRGPSLDCEEEEEDAESESEEEEDSETEASTEDETPESDSPKDEPQGITQEV